MIKEFTVTYLFLPCLYCQHHFLSLFYCHNCHPPFPFPALLSTRSSPSPLLPTPTAVTCFGHQLFPFLLSTPSLFLLWPMLGTKLKFSTNLILIADQCQVIESTSSSASSFASHVREQSTDIIDNIA